MGRQCSVSLSAVYEYQSFDWYASHLYSTGYLFCTVLYYECV